MRTAFQRAIAAAASPTNFIRRHQRTVAFASLAASQLARTMSYSASYIASARKQRLVYGSDDTLFGHIEAQQGDKPFGSFLDAGTGVHSLRWIATLAAENKTENPKQISPPTMTDFTAVTADENMRRNVQTEVDALGISHLGNVVIGNWFPPDGDDKLSLSSIDHDEGGNTKLYDTILADYLIGAMDGFSPFSQDQMIEKLAKRLKPGGRLYIVGLEPIPDKCGKDRSNPKNIICEVRQARDACLLLAGDRMYREFPLDWIERQVRKIAEKDETALTLLGSKTFAILYRHNTIVRQINVGRHRLKRFPTKALADEMEVVLNNLETRSKEATERIEGKRIQLGFDYVVTAERPMPAVTSDAEYELATDL